MTFHQKNFSGETPLLNKIDGFIKIYDRMRYLETVDN